MLVVTQSPCGRRYGVSRIDPDKFGPVVIEPPTMTYPEAYAAWERLIEHFPLKPRRHFTGENTKEAILKRRAATVERVRQRLAALQAMYPGTYLIYTRQSGKNPTGKEYCVLPGGWGDEMAAALGIEKKTHTRTTWSGVEYYAVPQDRFADVAAWAATKDKTVGIMTVSKHVNLIPAPTAQPADAA